MLCMHRSVALVIISLLREILSATTHHLHLVTHVEEPLIIRMGLALLEIPSAYVSMSRL
jgi:hypothetical protein